MNIAKARILMENLDKLVTLLTEEEMSDIARVMHRACDRMIKEAEAEVKANALD